MSEIIKRAMGKQFVIIAEIGVNYYDIAKKNDISVMDAAKLMIKEAKEAGAHAVKFQAYKAEKLASKYSPSYWDITEESTKTQYELFKKFDSFCYKEYEELAKYCNLLGIEFLSTAFDIESADYLYDLMNVYKISSSDLNNIPFVEYQAKKRKPMLLSIGASDLEEINQAIQVIRKHNDKPLVLLHCVLEYPTPYNHANLNKIITIKETYPNLIIGYSDHTKPDSDMNIITTAYNLGAVVIEKHFTLDKTIMGNDHYHAMTPADIKKIISKLEFIDQIRGSYEVKCLETEAAARKNARRSLVAACDINKGEKIVKEKLAFKRPGIGIPPSDLPNLIGKVALVAIKEDTILQYNMFI